jgi:hypothetical protein
MKGTFVFMYCLGFGMALSQRQYTDPIAMTFNTGEYVMQQAIFYSHEETAGEHRDAGFSLVMSGFQAKTYPEYQSLFFTHECHVSLNTWQNWKTHFGDSKPVIIANFILHQDNTVYGITKYSIRNNNKEYLLAQVHKQVNGKWYYLSQDENIERNDLVMFFASVHEMLFTSFHKDPFVLLGNTQLFSEQGKMRCTSLVNSYYDKYHSGTTQYDALNRVFEDRVRELSSTRSARTHALEAYFRSENLSTEQLNYLLNLLNASLTGRAITSFSEFTNKSITQISQECPNAFMQ